MLKPLMFMHAPEKGEVTISESTRQSLQESIGLLKNAAAYAARNDSPEITREIADVLCRANAILKYNEMMGVVEDYVEKMKNQLGD